MNTGDLLKFHEEFCDKAREIMRAKNHDYAGPSGETPFANFEACEQVGICTTEQGFLVRVMDKIKRLITFTQAGELKVEKETVEDGGLDIVNYIILFMAYLRDKGHLDVTCLEDSEKHII